MHKSRRVATMMLSLIVLGVTLTTVGFAGSSDILDFKVVSQSADKLVLEVDYVYAGNFGDQVTLQIAPARDGKIVRYFDSSPGKVAVGRHTTRVTLSLMDGGLKRTYTNQIQLSMHGKGSTFGGYVFRSEHFSLKKRWVSKALWPPEQVSPVEGAVFNNYPRTTRLEWRPVRNAASYGVQFDCYGCFKNGKYCAEAGESWYVKTGIKETNFTFDFVGAQPGAWRVWAIGADGKKGPTSPWRKFRYTK